MALRVQGVLVDLVATVVWQRLVATVVLLALEATVAPGAPVVRPRILPTAQEVPVVPVARVVWQVLRPTQVQRLLVSLAMVVQALRVAVEVLGALAVPM